MDSIPLRHCNKCSNDYPATSEYFFADKRYSSGFRSPCKQCIVDYRAANKEQLQTTRKKFYQGHAEEIKHASKTYDQLHKEHVRLRGQQYREAHKERIQLRRQEYEKVNRKRFCLYRQQWMKNHPDLVAVLNNRRRSRKKSANGSYTPQQIQAQYERQKGKCYYCQLEITKYHVDHVVPLSRGGSNGPSNLVIACCHCNTSKRDKLPHEWPEGGRLL